MPKYVLSTATKESYLQQHKYGYSIEIDGFYQPMVAKY